ncbi:AAA family ATPase [Pedococcus sp. 5OH_020]|uniref:AAA family ATPase n=1 Tax=Pedococcus sp. 5OH_020 TaxID=2989814 RepID=UPI0022E9D380|nr:AAA family ATPase [Pedococcus sp. 5OH_020]
MNGETPGLERPGPATNPGLAAALDGLAAVAAAAGLEPALARQEALSLAAAVAESAPRAANDWARACGGASTRDFFDAASRGRRWRESPTDLLSGLAAQGSPQAAAYARALAEVASAACLLGEPTIRVLGNASVAAAAQLAVVTSGIGSATGGDIRAERTDAGAPTGPADTLALVGDPGPAPATDVGAAAPPSPPQRTLEELLAELDGLIGLGHVKREIHRQVALLRVDRLRADAGLRSATITRHLVFTGNPGTGKTTVARLVGGIYRALGLLTRGQLVEVDRSELVAGYLGQTATKTADVVASAAGGVLFIDEAYSLTGGQGDQYGQESVDTLVKEMEDRRDDLVVIVAGYPEPMDSFISANPGLASRFRTTIEFEDYTDEELVAILVQLAQAADYELLPEAVDRFRQGLGGTPRGRSFGNGRFARNALEAAIGQHAWRLREVSAPSIDELRRLTAADFDDTEFDTAFDGTEGHDTDGHDTEGHGAAVDAAAHASRTRAGGRS